MISHSSLDVRRCRSNIEALLYYHGLPVPEVVATLKDRVMLRRCAPFVARLDELIADEKFCPWTSPGSLHGATAERTTREAVPRFSMQIVLHPELVEVDVDLFNPLYGDVVTAAGHLAEVAWPGKTDPWRVMRGLEKRGVL